MNKCNLGCGRNAIFYSKYSKKWRCEKAPSKCPGMKEKNSKGCAKAHREGRHGYTYNPNSAWHRGHTKETHPSVAKFAKALRGRKIVSTTEKIKRDRYYRKCKWIFHSKVYSKLPGYELLVELGMYNKHTNKDGVVRDHRYSVYDGYMNDVDPAIISHPANCEILTHKDNARKTRNSSITLKELYAAVSEWVDEQR